VPKKIEDLSMTDFIQFEQAILSFGSLILGPFLGVLLAFAINKVHSQKMAYERLLFFKSLLLHEIHRSINLLETDHPNLIPIDAWNSFVNSGDMALFTHDLAIQLSDIYFDIQNYNYEVDWKWKVVANRREIYYDIDKISPHFEDITKRNPYLQEITDHILNKLKIVERELNKI